MLQHRRSAQSPLLSFKRRPLRPNTPISRVDKLTWISLASVTTIRLRGRQSRQWYQMTTQWLTKKHLKAKQRGWPRLSANGKAHWPTSEVISKSCVNPWRRPHTTRKYSLLKRTTSSQPLKTAHLTLAPQLQPRVWKRQKRSHPLRALADWSTLRFSRNNC